MRCVHREVIDGVFGLDEAAVRGAIRKSGQFKQTLALGLSYKF